LVLVQRSTEVLFRRFNCARWRCRGVAAAVCLAMSTTARCCRSALLRSDAVLICPGGAFSVLNSGPGLIQPTVISPRPRLVVADLGHHGNGAQAGGPSNRTSTIGDVGEQVVEWL
jgi:hypothetical protein